MPETQTVNSITPIVKRLIVTVFEALRERDSKPNKTIWNSNSISFKNKDEEKK